MPEVPERGRYFSDLLGLEDLWLWLVILGSVPVSVHLASIVSLMSIDGFPNVFCCCYCCLSCFPVMEHFFPIKSSIIRNIKNK